MIIRTDNILMCVYIYIYINDLEDIRKVKSAVDIVYKLAWRSYRKKDIDELERIQRRVTTIWTGD